MVKSYKAEKLSIASPLYEMAATLQKTEGINRMDRVKWAINVILAEVIGPPITEGSTKYVTLQEMVDIISRMDPGPEDRKPRDFLQSVGSLIRQTDSMVLLNNLKRKIGISLARQQAEKEDAEPIVVVSDVRMPKEVDFLKAMGAQNVMLFCPENVRLERLMERGETNVRVTSSHHLETDVDLVTDDNLDFGFNTDELTPQEICVKILGSPPTGDQDE